MQESEVITRTYTVERELRSRVREILSSRVRLKFTERRRWVPLFSFEYSFSVTGPVWVQDQAFREINEARGEWIENHGW